MDAHTWIDCENTREKCHGPNMSHTPDITPQFIPENLNACVQIPYFLTEIIGSKNIWSTVSTTRDSYLCGLQSLVFMDTAFILEIKHSVIRIYQIKRNTKYGCIDVTVKEYNLGAPNLASMISNGGIA